MVRILCKYVSIMKQCLSSSCEKAFVSSYNQIRPNIKMLLRYSFKKYINDTLKRVLHAK